MNIPFSVDQFFRLFRDYNLSVWPMHIIMYILALLIFILLFIKTVGSSRLINGILAFYWLWMGVFYHLIFFSEINFAANIFGALFIIQGILFLWLGVFKNSMPYKFKWHWLSIIGGLMIFYGTIAYPLLGNFLEHLYPAKPMFGVAPCPTVIFTFGILLMSDRKMPWGALIIPVIWSVIGFSAALQLSVPEDYGLFAAGMLTVILIVFRKRFPTISGHKMEAQH